MKLYVKPVKGYAGRIESDKPELLKHFVGDSLTFEDRADNWIFLEAMCKAHNEAFERIE